MPFRPCPACQFQTPRLLEGASGDAYVHYNRCEACGHVWSILKSDTDGPMSAMTVDQLKKEPGVSTPAMERESSGVNNQHGVVLVPDAAPITLPAHCDHCGKRVTLQMFAWSVALMDDTPPPSDPPTQHQQTWACPWCHWGNTNGFPDRLAWARKGHATSPTRDATERQG